MSNTQDDTPKTNPEIDTELTAEDLGQVSGGVRGYSLSGIVEDDPSDVKVK